MFQNDSLHSFPDDLDDSLDVNKIRTKSSLKKDKKGKKLDAQVSSDKPASAIALFH